MDGCGACAASLGARLRARMHPARGASAVLPMSARRMHAAELSQAEANASFRAWLHNSAPRARPLMVHCREDELLTLPNSNQVSNKNDTSTISKNIKSGVEVKSPIIGTAYHAPEPGTKKFVEIGKKIKKGDTVMIVEAMKTMNHVPSTSEGVVKEILVEDGQPVEFGQTLIILE